MNLIIGETHMDVVLLRLFGGSMLSEVKTLLHMVSHLQAGPYELTVYIGQDIPTLEASTAALPVHDMYVYDDKRIITLARIIGKSEHECVPSCGITLTHTTLLRTNSTSDASDANDIVEYVHSWRKTDTAYIYTGDYTRINDAMMDLIGEVCVDTHDDGSVSNVEYNVYYQQFRQLMNCSMMSLLKPHKILTNITMNKYPVEDFIILPMSEIYILLTIRDYTGTHTLVMNNGNIELIESISTTRSAIVDKHIPPDTTASVDMVECIRINDVYHGVGSYVLDGVVQYTRELPDNIPRHSDTPVYTWTDIPQECMCYGLHTNYYRRHNADYRLTLETTYDEYHRRYNINYHIPYGFPNSIPDITPRDVIETMEHPVHGVRRTLTVRYNTDNTWVIAPATSANTSATTSASTSATAPASTQPCTSTPAYAPSIYTDILHPCTPISSEDEIHKTLSNLYVPTYIPHRQSSIGSIMTILYQYVIERYTYGKHYRVLMDVFDSTCISVAAIRAMSNVSTIYAVNTPEALVQYIYSSRQPRMLAPLHQNLILSTPDTVIETIDTPITSENFLSALCRKPYFIDNSVDVLLIHTSQLNIDDEVLHRILSPNAIIIVCGTDTVIGLRDVCQPYTTNVVSSYISKCKEFEHIITPDVERILMSFKAGILEYDIE